MQPAKILDFASIRFCNFDYNLSIIIYLISKEKKTFQLKCNIKAKRSCVLTGKILKKLLAGGRLLGTKKWALVAGDGEWSTNALVSTSGLLLNFHQKNLSPMGENATYFSEPTNMEWSYMLGIRYLVANLISAWD